MKSLSVIMGSQKNQRAMEPVCLCTHAFLNTLHPQTTISSLVSPSPPPIWLTLKPGFLPLFFGTLSGGRDSGYRLGKSILATLRSGGLPLFLPGIFPDWLGMKEGATAADCISLLLPSDFCTVAAGTLIWSWRQKKTQTTGELKQEKSTKTCTLLAH